MADDVRARRSPDDEDDKPSSPPPEAKDARGKDGRRDKPEGKDKPEDDKPDKPPLYKRPLFWIILVAVAAVAIVEGTLYWLHARQYVSTDDAFVDAHIVRLSPQVSGRLVWVADKDNQHVRAGELLAVIEETGPSATREQAVAGVAQAEAGIEESQGRVLAARAQRAQAVANAAVPEAAAVKAAQDLARYEALLRIDPAAVAGTTLDQARAEARRTAAQALATRRDIGTADANILVARKGVSAAGAQRRAAQAQVAQADVTVGDLRVRAPVAGQVVNRSVNIGSSVSPQTQMMAVVPDAMWITANFKETQLRLMRRGQRVTIRIDAFPDAELTGYVDSIQHGAGQAFALLPAQNATGNYVKVVQRVPVRIRFDHAYQARYPIGPGMSVVPTVKVR